MSSVPMNLRRAAREQTAEAPWVYVLGHGPYLAKLGVTSSPEDRALRLRAELLWVRFLGSAAFEAEQMLHGLLEEERWRGKSELYDVPPHWLARGVAAILADIPRLEEVDPVTWRRWGRDIQVAYSEPVIRALNLSRLFRLPD